MITQEQRDKLREYFSSQPVEVVYLFGSQTNGKANKLSDVDLAVLFKEGLSQSERFDLRLEYINKAGEILKMPDKTEVIDLKAVKPMLVYNAIFPKQEIFVRSKKKMIELEMRAVRQYLDMKYYLARINRTQLNLLSQKGFKYE